MTTKSCITCGQDGHTYLECPKVPFASLTGAVFGVPDLLGTAMPPDQLQKNILELQRPTTDGIDCGDRVHHGPSGEDWVVAAVDDGRLYWCGYPFGGYADIRECALLQKASNSERLRVLTELAGLKSQERPVILAKKRLEDFEKRDD